MVWAFRGEARKGILTSSNRVSLGDAMGMQHAFDYFFTPTVLVKHQRFFLCDSTRETGREREREIKGSRVVLCLGTEAQTLNSKPYSRPLINKPPPLNRAYDKDLNFKALQRRGFMNHGSTLDPRHSAL